jgi:hypothetical protein
MIVARTGMEHMPEGCGECEHRYESLFWSGRHFCSIMTQRLLVPEDGKHELCPLTEIDEMLPAQLAAAKADVAAAEARIKKLDRLLDESL